MPEPLEEPSPWEVLDRRVAASSRWMTVLDERLVDDAGRTLEWWRIERASSMVVVVVHRGRLVLPTPSFRPGIGAWTLDLAGGRLDPAARLQDEAIGIVRDELELGEQPLGASVELLRSMPWHVDSSTSDQRLVVMSVSLGDEVAIAESAIGRSAPATIEGARVLADELACLQCWAALRAWGDANQG